MLGNQSYPSASTLLGRGEKHGLSPRLQEETPLLRGLQAPALLVQRVMSPSTLQHTTKAGSGPMGTGHRHLSISAWNSSRKAQRVPQDTQSSFPQPTEALY